jgi:hypothetical protein
LGRQDWRLQPHAVASRTFKHVRGSFPMAMEAIATLGKSKDNVNFIVKMTENSRHSVENSTDQPCTSWPLRSARRRRESRVHTVGLRASASTVPTDVT